MSREQGIQQVMNGGGHVVILGAGASIASCIRNPEKNGKKLPSMDSLIDVVGLQEIVERVPKALQSTNFEQLYSNVYTDNPNSKVVKEINVKVYEYFKGLELPDEPTIYDYLVLSLRSKDLIATYNWDPFLYQAWVRNNIGERPYLAFLHGNVAIGYSEADDRCGPVGYYSKATGSKLEPTQLLYPVAQKNYNQDKFIKNEWDRIRLWLSKESTTVRATIFGYGAPATDVEAVSLMNQAWGSSHERNMEQFEMIDVRSEKDLTETWKGFIHSHHYDYCTNYFDSVLAYFPRRTSDAYFRAYQALTPAEMFQEPNPVPQDFKTLEEMHEWFKPLIEAEKKK